MKCNGSCKKNKNFTPHFFLLCFLKKNICRCKLVVYKILGNGLALHPVEIGSVCFK